MATTQPTGTPKHIGIIMDGNGRWATMRNMRRTRGHREGVEAAKRVVREAIAQGIKFLSLYAFSTENWRRAEEEVSFIMALVARNLRDQYDFYREHRVRVRHSGDLSGLPAVVRREIEVVTTETEKYDAITINLAVNYGGRNEIVRAVNRWLKKQGDGIAPTDLDEAELHAHLDLPFFPDPDLIIRTGGEQGREVRRLNPQPLRISHQHVNGLAVDTVAGQDVANPVARGQQRRHVRDGHRIAVRVQGVQAGVLRRHGDRLLHRLGIGRGHKNRPVQRSERHDKADRRLP